MKRRTTREKLIKFRKIKYSKGYLDEIDEIIFQEKEDIEEKELNMPSYVKNPYQVQILVQVVQILVMVVLAMI